MLLSTLSRKEYALLGRLLVHKQPAVAQGLIETYNQENVPPAETDHSRIEHYFQLFCRQRAIEPEFFRGPLHKCQLVDVRRVFIATMIRLFNPQAYKQPTDSIALHYGFVRSLANVLQYKEANISRVIREIVVRERVYEEFAEQVTNAINRFIKKEEYHGCA